MSVFDDLKEEILAVSIYAPKSSSLDLLLHGLAGKYGILFSRTNLPRELCAWIQPNGSAFAMSAWVDLLFQPMMEVDEVNASAILEVPLQAGEHWECVPSGRERDLKLFQPDSTPLFPWEKLQTTAVNLKASFFSLSLSPVISLTGTICYSGFQML